MDIKVILINSLFRSFLVALVPIFVAAVAAAVSVMAQLVLALSSPLLWSPTLITAAYSISLFVFDDWSRYHWHRLQHRLPLLWHFHRIHHSAEVLTPLTLYRTHPVDILGGQLRLILSRGFVIGLFLALFGSELSVWEILGAEALGFLFNALGANLRHSHHWLHFGPFECMFISPAAHQIHHSADPGDFDTNFGACFSIWDRIGGSYRDPRQQRPVSRFGLLSEQTGAVLRLNLRQIYWHPLRTCFAAKSNKHNRMEPLSCLPEARFAPK